MFLLYYDYFMIVLNLGTHWKIFKSMQLTWLQSVKIYFLHFPPRSKLSPYFYIPQKVMHCKKL